MKHSQSTSDCKRHMLINWDGGSIERGMLNHRQWLAPSDMVCMIEEIVDEHARAGVGTYVHVVFAMFLMDFPRGENPPMLLDGDNELAVTWHSGNGQGAVTVDELKVYVHVSDDLRPDVG